ncbi:MAG: hypothetical protein CUN56_00130 [Phototrophicales bacterium]|nr:MAG: hypothetical protein CUN56_00130 [Phototrophicales bacterium]
MEAVSGQLDRLQGHWKQRSTILAILAAEVTGQAWDKKEFWGRSDTAARSTYYKWTATDPVFSAVLQACRTAVQNWRSDRALKSIAEAQLILQEAGPEVARQLVALALGSRSDHVKVQAALGALDRMHPDTAAKQTHMISPDVINATLHQIYGDDESE